MSIMSNPLLPHELQHSSLLCPPLSPGVYSTSCAWSQWCYLTISSSVTPFSSCPQSFPASGSFPMSQFFISGGQNIGASTSVLPMNIQLISSRISWDFPGKNIAVGCFTSFSRGSFWSRDSWPMSPALPMNSLPMIHQGNPISIIGNVIGNS